MIKNQLRTFIDYRFLLLEFIKRDIKVKYKNSFLGIIWSILEPLLNMIVLTFIFSSMFENSIPNFPIYVLSGRLLYGFFSQSVTSCIKSITGKSSLIKKIYVPKYIYPLSSVISNFIIFLLSLTPLFIIMITSGLGPQKMNLLIIYPLGSLFFISFGLGLLLASINVFFRDLEHLFGIVLLIIMYMSAIFYSIDIIDPDYMYVMYLNPIFPPIVAFRDCILYSEISSITSWVLCLVYPILYILVGVFTFYNLQDKFILHI